MEPLYSGGLLSSPIWWSQIADSHCLSWKAAACMLPACGPVYYAALSLASTKTVHWSTNTDPAGATWQQIPNSLEEKKKKKKKKKTTPSPPSVEDLGSFLICISWEGQGPEFRCCFKCVFSTLMSLLSYCIQSKERNLCVLRRNHAITKGLSRLRRFKNRTKGTSQDFTSDTAGRNPKEINWCKKWLAYIIPKCHA